MTRVLVLFDSRQGATRALAGAVAAGVEQQAGCTAVLRRIGPAGDDGEIPALACAGELARFDGVAFGSPVHFGNMSAAMREFLDGTVGLWNTGALQGKPASVFMAAGSGAGREAAILSFWNTLALHGMLLVPTGIQGVAVMNHRVAQGNTPFGASTLASESSCARPTEDELRIARLQGRSLARAARALRIDDERMAPSAPGAAPVPAAYPPAQVLSADARLAAMGITLPEPPQPVGQYASFRRAGRLLFINQIALANGQVVHAGVIGEGVSEEQARAATRQTLLNVLAVLRQACGGDLGRVGQCVQLTGFFAAPAGYGGHAGLLDEASAILVDLWGDHGKHARAAVGASSLPMGSPCEIQAIFELA